ncbi:hypothetical protein NXS19_010686 [Fusarium pseudograminearum]|nr:hypothetical protein FPSE5266_02474 [Fusarium pseudograminearum]UZP42870.1 hypothetical protein NXS19_010686 [Fusarium pseudograminearum]
MPHPGDDDRVTKTIRGHIIYCILIKLPFEQLQAYQNTVAAVNAQNTETSKVKPDFYFDNMKRLERFMVEPEAVWVAEDWLDFVGFRTLVGRVHTAEQMRPYMRDLYHWLVDSELPDSYSQRQVARFPETTAAVAAEIIDDVVAGKEALWENVGRLDNMVSNVLSVYAPIGKDWVLLRKPIESLAEVLKEVVKKGGWDDYESCLEACEEWLSELDKWERDKSEEE